MTDVTVQQSNSEATTKHEPKTLSNLSLLFGIFGIFPLFLFGNLIGLVLGVIALNSKHESERRGAVPGLILSGIVYGIVAIIVLFSFFVMWMDL